MVVSAPLRWLGILLLALASLGCGVLDKLTSSDQLSIQEFSASPVTIPPGSSSTLKWDVEGSETVSIDNGIGAVPAKGTRQVVPGSTTTYRITAQSGTSQATASLEIQVQGTSAATPTPPPSPTATPTAGPTATPGPTPTPATPAPTATPTPTPVATACGAAATGAGNCAVAITRSSANTADSCVEVNVVTVDRTCPVGPTLPVLLRFDVTARTSRPTLNWRRAPGNTDVMDPGEGTINGNGSSQVMLTDVVLDDSADIEILDGSTVLLTLSVHH